MTVPALEARGLTLAWNPSDIIVRDVSLVVWPGEVVCLVGRSGCGKTTILHALSGLTQPVEGHGGAQETSADLWIDPDSVDLDALGPQDLVDDGGCAIGTVGFDQVSFEGATPMLLRRARRYATNGWIGPDDPADASAEWGERMLTATADWVCDFVDAFEKSPLPKPIDRVWPLHQ